MTKEEDRKGGVLHFEPLYMQDHVTSVRLNRVNVDAVAFTEAMANCTAHTRAHTLVIAGYLIQECSELLPKFSVACPTHLLTMVVGKHQVTTFVQ